MNTDPRSTQHEHSQYTRRGFLALSAGGAAALLAGCGSGQGVGAQQGAGVGGYSGGGYHGPPITLAYWNGFTGGDGPSMDKLVNGFNHSQNKIHIVQNTMEWADFDQKLPAAAQAGKGPDVAAMHLSSIATYAAQGIIAPLDDLAKALGLQESDFVSAVWRGGIYQGKRYGIPLDVHCIGIYWNKEHFKKAGITAPPTDAASLDAACQKLKAAGFSQPFWRPNQWPAQLTFQSLVFQNNGQIIAPDGTKALFDSPAGVKGITWMLEAIKKGYSPSNVDLDAQYLAFKNGKNSITFDGIWQINDLKAAKVPFGLHPLPTIGATPAVWADSHEFVMTQQAAQDKNKANAVKAFIGWMSKQSAAWSGAGLIPARNSARQEPAFTQSTQSVFADYLDNLHFLPPVPGWTFVEPTTMDTAVSDIILGKASPSAGLTKAAGNATKMMQENLQKYSG